jgi:capsid portal protein
VSADEVVILKAAGDGGVSMQVDDDDPISWGAPDDTIRPPEDLGGLAALSKISGTRRAIIDTIALNTVGLGVSVDPLDGHELSNQDVTKQRRAILDQLDALAQRDRRLECSALEDLLSAVKHDEEACGNGAIEVSRNRRTGQIDGLFHVPGHRVRRKRDRSGYYVVSPTGDTSKAITYYNFGEKVIYEDGKPTAKLVGGGAKRWDRNELIVFRLYTTESRDYGLPRDVALAQDYLGDKLAADANTGFFDASATPPTVIFVQGEQQKNGAKITFKVPDDTVKKIADTMRPEPGRRSRVAIIPVPAGTKTDVHQLSVLSDRDMGFTEFRDANRQRQMTSFRMQPIFIAVNDQGRYDAEVQRSITLEQLFDPEQRRWERKLRHTLLSDLGHTGWEFAFKRLAVEGDIVRRESTERGAEVGVVTRREFRDAHGQGPLPEGDGGVVPEGWNDELIEVVVKSAPSDGGGTPPVNDASDQRGLRPGIGGRTSRDKRTGQPRHVEATVGNLKNQLAQRGRRSAQAALARAGN